MFHMKFDYLICEQPSRKGLFLIAIFDILGKARVADDGVADHLLGQRPLGEADDGLLAVFLLFVDPGQHVEQRGRRAAS